MEPGAKKVLLIVLALFILFPFLPAIRRALTPVPLTIERFHNALAARFSVDAFDIVEPAQMEAVEQANLYVSGASVSIFRYNAEGKIVKQMEFNKPDSGSIAVEAMGIAQSLGAKVAHQTPTIVTRNGMFMLIVSSEDKALNSQIAQVFESL